MTMPQQTPPQQFTQPPVMPQPDRNAPRGIGDIQPAQYGRDGRWYPAVNLRYARRVFSRMGFALLAFFLLTYVFVFLLAAIIGAVDGGDLSDNASLIISSVAQYVLALPIFLLIIKRVPAAPPQPLPGEPDSHLGVQRWLTLLLMGFPIMYIGSAMGQLLSQLLSNGKAEDSVETITSVSGLQDLAVQFMVFVVLAPLVEEFVFRKCLIDRLRPFGEKVAIVTSALLFGLMHGNLYQCFYAFGWGLIWGYAYMRTGRIRYSVGLHASVNFIGGIIAPLVVSGVDLDALSTLDQSDSQAILQYLRENGVGLLLLLVWALLILGLSVAGLIMMIIRRHTFMLTATEGDLAPGNRCRTALGNPGVVSFMVLTVLLAVGAPLLSALG